MRTEADDTLDTDVRAALAAALEATGLDGRLDVGMPWIQEPGATGGYWIGFGLEHWAYINQEDWRTFLSARWVSEDEGDRACCLDVHLSGRSARDGVVLAAMALAAVRADLARRKTEAGG